MRLTSIILALLLSALLIGLSLTFMGDIVGESSKEAEVTKALKQADSIKEAVNLYRIKNKGHLPLVNDGLISIVDLQTLSSDGYLKTKMTGWKVDSKMNFFGTTGKTVNENACLAVNKRAGFESETIPSCETAKATMEDGPYFCCDNGAS